MVSFTGGTWVHDLQASPKISYFISGGANSGAMLLDVPVKIYLIKLWPVSANDGMSASVLVSGQGALTRMAGISGFLGEDHVKLCQTFQASDQIQINGSGVNGGYGTIWWDYAT